MELKLGPEQKLASRGHPFNRTTMELKLSSGIPIWRIGYRRCANILEAGRIAEQIARFAGDIFDLSEVFSSYSYNIRVGAITDPAKKMIAFIEEINKLADFDIATDSDLYKKLVAGNATLQDLRLLVADQNLADQRRIIEHIAQIERDIRQE